MIYVLTPLTGGIVSERDAIRDALASQLVVSDRYSIVQEGYDIVVAPRFNKQPILYNRNPAVYHIHIDDDKISIEVSRATGNKVVGVFSYEDPRMFDNLACALARLGVKFLS